MSNDPKTDLIHAILALDSYNRGYGAGISGLAEVGQIGSYTIRTKIDSEQTNWQSTGFYALAYRNSSGETVISYRGTDANFVNPFGSEGSDLVNGYGLALGIYNEPQPDLALRFYQAVAGFDEGASPFTANIATTGHSLGGGLAGYVARLYGRSGIIFDNMPFELGATVAHATSFVSSSTYSYLYGAHERQAPTNTGLSAFATTGEFLGITVPVYQTHLSRSGCNCPSTIW